MSAGQSQSLDELRAATVAAQTAVDAAAAAPASGEDSPANAAAVKDATGALSAAAAALAQDAPVMPVIVSAFGREPQSLDDLRDAAAQKSSSLSELRATTVAAKAAAVARDAAASRPIVSASGWTPQNLDQIRAANTAAAAKAATAALRQPSTWTPQSLDELRATNAAAAAESSAAAVEMTKEPTATPVAAASLSSPSRIRPATPKPPPRKGDKSARPRGPRGAAPVRTI